MKKTLLFASLLAVLFSCGSKITEENPGEKEAEPEEMSDVEKFNAVPLKSDIEKIASGSTLCDVEQESLCQTLRFTDGTSIVVGKRYGALVSSDSDGYVTVNGKKQDFRVVDYPYYTLSEDGEWYKQGVATGTSVVKSAPAGIEGTYLTFIDNNVKRLRFHFSDGSTTDLPYEKKCEMYVKKSASEMDVYIGQEGSSEYIMYPFKKRYIAWKPDTYRVFLDNWGILALRLCTLSEGTFDAGTELFLNGEAEMAVQVTDGATPSKFNYVGGVLHGFENIVENGGKRGLTINVDGVDIAEDGTFDLKKASKIVMTQSSELCQAYTNTNPFAHAERIWTFENGRLTVKIELTLLRDMAFNQAMFGMLCVLRRWNGSTSENYLTSYAVKDNTPQCSVEVKDGWGSMGKDHATTKITEYGERGWSFALCVDEATLKDKGGMFVGTNGNAYNKIYFDLTGSYSAVKDEVLSAQVHWEIEKYY